MTTSQHDQRPAGSAIHPILRHNIRLDRIVYLPIDDVKTYGRKLRKRAKGAIEAIEASIKGFGIVSPILVDQQGTIIAGEAIVEAARRIGYDEVPTIRIDHLDKTEVRFLRIALNKLATTSSWDEIELGAEFGELRAIETELAYEVTGFGTIEIDNLVHPAPVTTMMIPTTTLARSASRERRSAVSAICGTLARTRSCADPRWWRRTS